MLMDGVRPWMQEYLHVNLYDTVFNMSRDKYMQLPKFRRNLLKKNVGL